MERFDNDLFSDPTIEEGKACTAGINLCGTAIGGTISQCVSNFGSANPDPFLDTGP